MIETQVKTRSSELTESSRMLPPGGSDRGTDILTRYTVSALKHVSLLDSSTPPEKNSISSLKKHWQFIDLNLHCLKIQERLISQNLLHRKIQEQFIDPNLHHLKDQKQFMYQKSTPPENIVTVHWPFNSAYTLHYFSSIRLSCKSSLCVSADVNNSLWLLFLYFTSLMDILIKPLTTLSCDFVTVMKFIELKKSIK